MHTLVGMQNMACLRGFDKTYYGKFYGAVLAVQNHSWERPSNWRTGRHVLDNNLTALARESYDRAYEASGYAAAR